MRDGFSEEIHPTQPQRHQQRRKRHKAARNTAPKSFPAWTLARREVANRRMFQTRHDGRRGNRSDYNHRVAEQRRPIKRVQASINRRSKKTQNFQKRENYHRKKGEPARRKQPLLQRPSAVCSAATFRKWVVRFRHLLLPMVAAS